jgi:hypothetical protein
MVKRNCAVPVPDLAKKIVALRQGPIGRATIPSIAIRVAALALGFVQAILTARLLGPEGYGLVAVALSVATIDLHGELGAILALVDGKQKLPDTRRAGSSLSVVAGAGFDEARTHLSLIKMV